MAKHLTIVEVPQRLVTAYERLSQEVKDLQAKQNRAKNALIAALKGRDTGGLKDGRFVTYRQIERDSYVIQAYNYMKLAVVDKLS